MIVPATTSILFVLLLFSSVGLSGAEARYDPERLPKGHEYFELRAGLSNSRLKFEREKVGRVVFLGGSITASKGWRDQTMNWLVKRFPQTKFDFISAGVPSLGSVPHSFRLDRDVLSHGPIDLLFVEAAVNDASNMKDLEQMLRGMEGVVRHIRMADPMTDILQMHFVMPEHMDDYRAGKTPIAIAQHERVAKAYGNPSLDLAREITDRIDAGEFDWDNDFKNLHPSSFGHRIYGNSICRMLEGAWTGTLSNEFKAHRLPEAIDSRSYFRGRFGDIRTVQDRKGFEIEEAWQPGDGKATRPGFVKLPALVGSDPGAEFTFDFEGNAVGLFITAGPDAGRLEFQIDNNQPEQAETFTSWSSSLHLPWAVMLDDGLTPGNHHVRIRILTDHDERSVGTALRVHHLLLN
jgi:sialidase-1